MIEGEITSSRQACGAVTRRVFPRPSPTTHSLFSRHHLHSARKQRRSARPPSAANPSGFRGRTGMRRPSARSHCGGFLLYTRFMLPIGAICACLAASQTFGACALHHFPPEIAASSRYGFGPFGTKSNRCVSALRNSVRLFACTNIDRVETEGSKHQETVSHQSQGKGVFILPLAEVVS